MFFSHQLLARKTPLGQIWMAATMDAKLNRRKLDKLNIIQICEEILNPSVPMALRLSGILMGGVVIIYERKVQLLYDDMNRLLVELNKLDKARKVKAVSDPTLLPRGKSRARREDVTLPDPVDTDLLHFPHTTTTTGFQQTPYFAMRLDSVDEPFIRNQPMEEDPLQQLHQADADNITFSEHFDSYQATDLHDRFERFDFEGDDETQMNFNSGEHTQIPTTFIPSPPRNEPQQADVIPNHHPKFQLNQQSDERKEAYEDQQEVGARKRKKRASGAATIVMDYDQITIRNKIYQSWLQDASDIVSKRGRKRKHANAMSTVKIARLMELPRIVLSQPPHDSPSGRTSVPQPLEPSDRVHYGDPIGFPSEDPYSRAGFQSVRGSTEKQRENTDHKDMTTENVTGENRANLDNNGKENGNIFEVLNLVNNGAGGIEVNSVVTHVNFEHEVISIPSSGSGHGIFSHNSEVNLGRSNKKRHYSSSGHSGNGVKPVAEEKLWQKPDSNFKQSGHPIKDHPMEQKTDSFRMHMKALFDTPGTPDVVSLNSLASGMSKSTAAQLFFQTCELASRDILRVDQKVPYGDIRLSKGTKM